jgi:uncharacterized protein
MNQAALMEVLRTYDAALRENGATGLFMFGSRALGMSQPDSDLDLFIDYDPEAKVPNMFRLIQIEEERSRALGVRAETLLSKGIRQSLINARIPFLNGCAKPALNAQVREDAVRAVRWRAGRPRRRRLTC